MDYQKIIVYIIKKYLLIIKLFMFILNFLLLPIISILYIIRFFMKFQILRLQDARIGELSRNNEIHLRRIQLNMIDKKIHFIFIAIGKPSNSTILNMYKKKMNIIHLHEIFRYLFFFLFREDCLLTKLKFLGILGSISTEYYEFSKGKPCIEFTDEEIQKGQKILNNMNINKSDWYICFHSRDNQYLKKQPFYKYINQDHTNYRNWDINTTSKALKYISSQNGFSLRMGAVVKKRLGNKFKNEKIIDYASYYRTDFGDIYLPVNCKFFLGCSCGINHISQIFNIPVIFVNVIPIQVPPNSDKDLFIPKLYYSIKNKRLLKFSEMLKLKIGISSETKVYKEAGIRIIHNTSDEIYEITKEMNERINGTWKETKKDKFLQKKYKSLFKKESYCYGFPSRIGAKFLRKYEFLLD